MNTGTGEKKFATLEDWHTAATELFGPDYMDWKFICPVCLYVASVQDYKDAGAPSEAAAVSCIGRYLPEDKVREAFGDAAPYLSGPCNYAGYGLFRLNPVDVAGQGAFDFAPVETGTPEELMQMHDALIKGGRIRRSNSPLWMPPRAIPGKDKPIITMEAFQLLQSSKTARRLPTRTCDRCPATISEYAYRKNKGLCSACIAAIN